MTMMTHTKTTNMKFQLFRGSSKSLNSLTTAVIAKKEFPIHCPTFFNGSMIHFNSSCKIFEITENISRMELKKDEKCESYCWQSVYFMQSDILS